MGHRFTIGVEEEFQIIDPTTGELRSHVSQLVAATSANLGEQVKREMHQSIVEIGTKICENVDELRADMHRTRGELVRSAESVGLYVGPPALTPFPTGSTRSSPLASATKTSSRNFSSWRVPC